MILKLWFNASARNRQVGSLVPPHVVVKPAVSGVHGDAIVEAQRTRLQEIAFVPEGRMIEPALGETMVDARGVGEERGTCRNTSLVTVRTTLRINKNLLLFYHGLLFRGRDRFGVFLVKKLERASFFSRG